MSNRNNGSLIPTNLALGDDFLRALQRRMDDERARIRTSIRGWAEEGRGDMDVQVVVDCAQAYLNMDKMMQEQIEALDKDRDQFRQFIKNEETTLRITAAPASASAASSSSDNPQVVD